MATFPDLPHIDQTREDVVVLKERSQHSAENRSYLTMRVDDLADLVSGPSGVQARLARLEEKVRQQEIRARRLIGWASAAVPLVAVLVQYLLSLSKG